MTIELTIHLTMQGRTKPVKMKQDYHGNLDELLVGSKIIVNAITWNKFDEEVAVKLSCDITQVEDDNIYVQVDENGEKDYKNARESGQEVEIIDFEEYRKNKCR